VWRGREKLHLAGRLDIKRLWDRIDAARQAYIDARRKGPNDNVDRGEDPEMGALRYQLRFGVFGEDSLFEKTRRRLLSAELGVAWAAYRERAGHSTVKITLENACALESVGRVSRDLHCLVRSPNDGRLGLVTFDKPVEICDGLDFKTVRMVGAGRRIVAFDFSPERDRVAIGQNSTKAILVNLATGQEVALETGNQQPHVAFSPDGKLLATGGYGTRAILWSVTSGNRLHELDAGPNGGLTPVFSPDGRIIAVGNRNSSTRLFDVATGELLRVLPQSQTQELRFDPSGKRLAVTYVNGSLGLWDVASGELVKIADPRAAELYSVDWSPDGKLIATSGLHGSVCLWNAANLEPIHEIESPEWVIFVRFNRQGTRLLFAGGAQVRGGERGVRIFAVPE
jgi:WD40 repeat protein